MGSISHRLLYFWEVDRAWRQNTNKISGSARNEKQKAVYKSLKVLQTMTDQNEFKNALNEFNNNKTQTLKTLVFILNTYMEAE